MAMASIREANSPDGIALKLLFTEAFARVGKTLVYRYYPAKRGTLMATSGRVDGELARGYKYGEKVQNLVRVEEPLIIVRLLAYVTDSRIKLDGWKSLAGTDFRIDFMRGQIGIGEKLSKIGNNGNVTAVSQWIQGLNKLALGRTDIYIGIEKTVNSALATERFNGAGIHSAGVMEEQPIHTYLHVKHKNLVPALSAVLKAMKNEGLIEKYIKIARQKSLVTTIK